MRPAILFAPAKLNLGLRVTGRYANGYHHLESLFVPVALYDRLHILPAPRPLIRYRWQFATTPQARRALAKGAQQNPLLYKSLAFCAAHNKRDLEWQQAMDFHSSSYGNPQHEAGKKPAMDFHSSYGNPQQFVRPPPAMENHSHSYGYPAPLAITLYKRIPSPAGLGGASADAAALIAHLVGLAGPGQAPAQLLAEATKLGADIPFFLQYGLWGQAAQLSGVGAQLRPVDLPELAGIVAVPSFGFSTAAMFGYFRAQDLPAVAEDNPPEVISHKSALRLNEIRYSDEPFPGVRVAQNDFGQAAAAVFPREARLLSAAQAKVAQAVRQICPGTWLAGMTGSGPALYAVTEGYVSSADLRRLSGVLVRRLGAFWQVYPIRSHRLEVRQIGP